MAIWKLGTTWGSSKEGKPSFYNFIKNENIVISVGDKQFQKNDLIAIAQGFKIKAIVKVLETSETVIHKPNLKDKFNEFQIDFEDWVEYATADWFELPSNLQFEYPNQTGICQIRGTYYDQILKLWKSHTASPGYKKVTSNEIREESKILNPLYKMPKNQILYGPPGTGKTYNTINKAIGIANPNFDLSVERSKVKDEYDRLVNEGQIVFTTFHQSLSYEDFIEGIKPISKEGQVTYDVLPGVFKKLCLTAEEEQLSMDGKGCFELAFEKLQQEWELFTEMKFPLKTEGNEYTIKEFTDTSIRFRKASGGEGHTLSITTLRDYYYQKRTPKNTGVGIYYPGILNKLLEYESDHIDKKDEIKNFVLVIDEINRGNVSQIFGELITLLEEDKRLGAPEALEATLPYSQEKFSVPSNLYVIGTMNTADRSVEALDTALRRRFSFEEMPPKSDLIKSVGELNKSNGQIGNIDLVKLMNTINKRIEKLLDKDHLIGHSYFLKVATIDNLKSVFQNSIIPLLQEYFYGDYGKIGLVIGRGFFENEGKQQDLDENLFAEFNDYNTSMLLEKPVYKLRTFSDKNNDFEEAIKLLLGIPVGVKVEPQLN